MTEKGQEEGPEEGPEEDKVEDSFFEGLIYEDKLPLEVERLAQAPDHIEILHNRGYNEQLLRSIALREEGVSSDQDNEMTELQQDVRQLEQKIDLVLSMLSDLVKQHVTLPDAAHVKLNAHFIQFRENHQANTYLSGDILNLKLYLSPVIPKPLVLTTQIIDQNSADNWISGRFLGQSSITTALLDKLVFRNHRREIAFLVDSQTGQLQEPQAD